MSTPKEDLERYEREWFSDTMLVVGHRYAIVKALLLIARILLERE
jgi:hypothetical protein